MDDSETPTSKSRPGPGKSYRLGSMLSIIVILIILLVLSFFWRFQSTTPSGHAAATGGSNASSVFLTLPTSGAAAAADVSAATDSAVALAQSTAKSLTISSATHSVIPPGPTSGPVKIPSSLPVAAKPVTIAHACQQAGWYVQLGAFGKAGMAENLRQQVDQAGVKACVGTLPVNHLYRVLVGPQASKGEAGTAAVGIGKKSGQKGAYPQYWSPE